MAFQESNDVNVSVEQIAAAYASEDFARFVCNEVGVNFVSFNLDGDPAGEYTITTERTIPADRVPDIAKKFVSNGVGMTQTDKVSAPAADGTRTVNTEVKVSGMPVSAQATQTLTPVSDTQARVDVNGEVSCSIPLVGKKIAAAAEPQVGRVLKVLGTSAEKWTAQQG